MNLLENKNNWYNFYPENLLNPDFKSGETLDISLPKNEYSLGKWICNVPIIANKTYELKVKAETNLTPLDVWVVISTHKADGSMDIREHANSADVKDGYIYFSHTFEATDDIVSAKVELWIKGTSGNVKFSDIFLTETAPLPPRNVSVCMAHINPYIDKGKGLKTNFENLLKALDNTKKHSPDIVVLSEGMYQRCAGATKEEYSQTEDGEDTCGWLPTRIISPLGNILAQTNEHLESAHCVIDLNKKERSFWLSIGPARTDAKGCYLFERNANIK